MAKKKTVNRTNRLLPQTAGAVQAPTGKKTTNKKALKRCQERGRE